MASASEEGGRHSLKGCQTQMVSLVWAGVVRVILRFRFDAEVAAGHVLGGGFAEDAKERRSDVAECTAGSELQRVVFRDAEKRDGIRGVVRVRAAGYGIDHGFGVAVIRGDDPGPAARLQRLIDAAKPGVDGLDGFDGGL